MMACCTPKRLAPRARSSGPIGPSLAARAMTAHVLRSSLFAERAQLCASHLLVAADSARYCLPCRPARSKHCRSCDRCVARFDHHCPWINTCVGAANIGHFISFLCLHVTPHHGHTRSYGARGSLTGPLWLGVLSCTETALEGTHSLVQVALTAYGGALALVVLIRNVHSARLWEARRATARARGQSQQTVRTTHAAADIVGCGCLRFSSGAVKVDVYAFEGMDVARLR